MKHLKQRGLSLIELLVALSIGSFLISPGMWIGLAVTAVFLFAAARLRRSREPV